MGFVSLKKVTAVFIYFKFWMLNSNLNTKFEYVHENVRIRIHRFNLTFEFQFHDKLLTHTVKLHYKKFVSFLSWQWQQKL